MARIVLTGTTLVQRDFLRLTNDIITVRQRADRLKAIVDQITNNGAATANLVSSLEASMPAGTGQTFQDGINSICTQLAALSSLVSAIDQGS